MYSLRYAFQPLAACRRMPTPPTLDGELKEWTSGHLLPDWFPDERNPPFGTVYAAWDDEHLYFAAQANLRRPPRVLPDRYWQSDGLELFLDLRGTLRRNDFTDHCVHFYFLPPAAGSAAPRGGRCEPGVENRVALADDPTLRVGGAAFPQGFRLEVALSREAIPSYDPAVHPLIGFNYLLRDASGREQCWTFGRELAIHRDPSAWGLLELADPT